jgi:hypothetical protein
MRIPTPTALDGSSSTHCEHAEFLTHTARGNITIARGNIKIARFNITTARGNTIIHVVI